MRTSTIGGASFWHSRVKLSVVCICLVFLIIVQEIRILGDEFEDSETTSESRESDDEDDFLKDTEKALEAIRYMKALQRGTAKVRGVWEPESQVEEWYWGCRPRFPERISASSEWQYGLRNVQLYSAHYDGRKNSLFPNNDAIQVLVMSDGSIEGKRTIYCTIYEGRSTAVVKGYIREVWQRAWDPRDDFWVPSLITCPLPRRFSGKTELLVGLTEKPCARPKVAIQVRNSTPKSDITRASGKRVAICVKGMDFQTDTSDRFLEWAEAQFLMGADLITVYTYTVSERTEAVLRLYVEAGKMEWIPLKLPNGFPNEPSERSAYIWRNRQQKRRLELIPYNDCFYRHVSTHDYVLIIDTDEVVVPLKHDNYSAMIEETESHNPQRLLSAISVRNVFKFPAKTPDPQYPEYMYMLRNSHRSRTTSKMGDYGKAFTSTRNVATVFNHFALHRLSRNVTSSLSLPETIALKLHYKEKCPIESRNECDELTDDVIVDTSLDRWKDRLQTRVESMRKKLGW